MSDYSGSESGSTERKTMVKVEEILRISKNGGRNDLSKLSSDEKKILQRTRNRISAQNHRQKQKKLLENLRNSLTRCQKEHDDLRARNGKLEEVVRLLKIESDGLRMRKQQLETQTRSIIQLVSQAVVSIQSNSADPAVLVNALTLALNVNGSLTPQESSPPQLSSSLAEQIASILDRREVRG
ncbi:MAG: uncharacterized protein KVP18_004458 [Porospora cf. gigantea A]|uniref:uncharacterized protein n=1 Tax=Porospora cf. gigantea A TaxID=2853593 RepID=UPI00355A8E74|nr:MAG: hypothetical protein KVP18_004458 [Porospora cf. gigantea A]